MYKNVKKYGVEYKMKFDSFRVECYEGISMANEMNLNVMEYVIRK